MIRKTVQVGRSLATRGLGLSGMVVVACLALGVSAHGSTTAAAGQSVSVGVKEPRADGIQLLKMGLWIGENGVDAFEALTHTRSGAVTRYRLHIPAAAKRRRGVGGKYPLVLYLHGASGRGTRNVNSIKDHYAVAPSFWVMPGIQKKQPCFVLAPQCPPRDMWVGVKWSTRSHTQPLRARPPLTRAVFVLDHIQQQYPIDPDRVYLVGQSMGGYGAWDLLARMPERFAASIILCGGADEKTAKKIASTPIWVFHGNADETVPVCRSQNMVGALRAAGGKPRYTEYDGADHLIYPYVFSEPGLADWLFSHKRSARNPTGARR